MITDEDIYAYLEHHGVKGMRWGHRRVSGVAQRAQKQRIREEDFAKNKNRERAITAVGIGAAAAITILKIHGNIKIRQAFR